MSIRTATPLLLVAAMLLVSTAASCAHEKKTAKKFVDSGMANNDRGQYDAAFKDFDQAIALDPAFAEAYIHRGLNYAYQGQYELGIKDCDKALDLSPSQANYYVDRGQVYEFSGKFDLAIKDYTRAIELLPKYALAYAKRGYVYLAMNKYDQAIAECDQAIENDPKLACAYATRGESFGRNHQPEKAMNDFDRSLTLEPDNAVFHNNYGGMIYQCIARPAAEKAARLTTEDASLTGSGSPEAAQAKGDEAAALNKKAEAAFAEAEAHFAKAIEFKPGYCDALANLGMLTFERHGSQDVSFAPIAPNPEIARKRALALGSALTGKEPTGFQKTELCYLIALSLKADHTGALNNIGNLYRTMMQQAEGEEQKALKNGNSAEAKSYHEDVLRYRKACEVRYRFAVKSKPDLLEAHANLAVFLEAEYRRLAATDAKKSDEEYNEAVACYYRAIECDPRNARVHDQLAMLLFERYHYNEALPQYLLTLQLGEQSPMILSSAAWIMATASDDKLRDGNKAVELAETAVQITKQQFPQALDALAAAYAECKKFDDAVRTEQQALNLAQSGGPAAQPLFKLFQQHAQTIQAHQPVRTPVTPLPQ